MKYLICIFLIITTSCKKENKSISKKETITEETKSDSILYKEFGKPSVVSINFPKKWDVNTYEDTIKKITKEDLNFQKAFDDIDYFNNQNGNKIDNKSFFIDYIKKDSLLGLSKIDTFVLLDSIIVNKKKILYIKTTSSIDSQDYEMPLQINKIDLVMFNGKSFVKSMNLYLEVNYPYSTKQNIGYLDKDGILTYKKFRIDENKTYYLGLFKTNVYQYFK